MRPASRGFGPRLFIRVRLRVYLPVDIGGALIGGIRHPRVFILIHTWCMARAASNNPLVPLSLYWGVRELSGFDLRARPRKGTTNLFKSKWR